MTEQKQTLRSRFLRPSLWGAALFWLWNTIFISFMLFGFGPIILPELLIEVQGGFLPVRFLISGIVLALIPVAATAVGLIWLRRDGAKLFALGYGVEAPLMMLFGLRFFVVRDLTWGMTFILSTAAVGVLVFGTRLILSAKNESESTPTVTIGRSWFAGMSLLLVVGLYFIAWISFYIPPMAVFSGDIIGEIMWSFPTWEDISNMSWADMRFLPMMLLFIPLFLLTSGLFLALPIAVTTIYVRAWWQTTKTAVQTTNPTWLAGGFTVIAAIWIGLFTFTNQQPQQNAFRQLAVSPTSPMEVNALLEQEGAIKEGLLNAYLSPFRYLTAHGEADMIKEMYIQAFYMDDYTGYRPNATSDSRVNRLQQAHDTLAQPLLYRPVKEDSADTDRWGNQAFEVESAEAAELYQRYFDQPIVKGEKETIVDAVGQTWRSDMGRAAVQAVDDREVLLARQEINITEHGTWADVELYEVYANQTMEQQEVVYFFSLPESAVLTGVWLGNSDDRDERFVYRVAPRGAAQEVYQSQVQVRQDPALLEQIGPTQYRLRIFPIEARQRNWDNEWQRSTLEDGAPLHMWLTFSVLAENGAWPMPKLAEKFNIYWNNQSERLLNGESLNLDSEAWFPEPVTAVSTAPSFPIRTDLANGMSVVIDEPDPSALDSLPQSSRLAVVLDRSYSMANYADDVQDALSQLATFNTDVYLTAAEVHPAEPQIVPPTSREITQLQYFGGQRPSELLSQFYDLRQNANAEYDAILILTDGAGYELGPAELELPASDTPLWFVHLGGQMPIGYDDDTLEAIQSSGGGAAASVDEALLRMANQTADGAIQLVDDLLWQVMPTDQAPSITATADFAPFATRALILSEMVRQRQNLDQLEALDDLHALAVENSIVTPYSSMIVLVTAAQERMLDELEKGEDRFDREYEEVGETENFNLTGVPEPHEWVLIILSVLLGGWYWVNGRRQTSFA